MAHKTEFDFIDFNQYAASVEDDLTGLIHFEIILHGIIVPTTN